jgi:serine/threonine-protein kinase
LITKRELLEAIWPHVVVEENNLTQAISALRRTLGETPEAHRFIVTEPGRGYRLVASVRTLSPSAGEPAAPPEAAASFRAADARSARAAVVKPPWPYFVGALVVAVAMLGAAWLWTSERDARSPAVSARPSAQGADALRAVLPNSVAVLPLANLSPGADQAAYAAAMHAEIIHQLSKLRNVNVIAREAVLQDVANRSPAERARDLRVRSILTGTFQYADGRIRVNVQLVDPTSNRNLWAQDYEERFENVFAVQADIATRVAAALGAELTVAERQRMETRPTTSGEAYALYLLALNHQQADRRIDALNLFERAVEIDSAFSLAYGKLALLYAVSLIDFSGGAAVSIAPNEVERRVAENARAALKLEPDSGAAYAALGVMHGLFWRWREAEDAYASALALNPNDLEALNYYAIFLTSRGRYREAMPVAQRILELYSSKPGVGSLYNIWLTHVYSGNVDAALAVLDETLAVEPAQMPARINLGYVHARRGDAEEAARAFRRVEEFTEGRRSPNLTAGLAYGYSRIGYAQQAMRLFAELESVAREASVGAGTWAIAHLAIGAEQQALEWLDSLLEKIENHEPDTGWFNTMAIKHNVAGDPVLDLPKFKERRERIGGD